MEAPDLRLGSLPSHRRLERGIALFTFERKQRNDTFESPMTRCFQDQTNGFSVDDGMPEV